jgi:hypothetical protein
MKIFTKKVTTLGTTAAALLLKASPVFAQTSPWEGVCVSTSDPDVATLQGLQCLLANVLSTFLTIVGIAAFIMLIVSSFRILLSGGDSQAMEKAKNSITYAIIGLVVAVSAFVILNLIAEFTGVKTILEFRIPSDS